MKLHLQLGLLVWNPNAKFIPNSLNSLVLEMILVDGRSDKHDFPFVRTLYMHFV